MKKTNQNNGFTLSNENIEKVELRNEIAVIDNEKMTAMDVIKIIDALSEITQGYLELLAKNCGACNDCDYCEDLDFEGIHLPTGILEIAGISEGTKLNAYVEEDAEVIHIEPAEYEHDISDVPLHLLELFSDYGICLGKLDALLVKGEVLQG